MGCPEEEEVEGGACRHLFPRQVGCRFHPRQDSCRVIRVVLLVEEAALDHLRDVHVM